MNLVILPFINNPTLTLTALRDAQAQLHGDVRVLLIDNGSNDPEWARMLAKQSPESIWLWRHDPPLPSLSACWNRALRFAWESGCEDVLVINNDIRLWEGTFADLRTVQECNNALFVSATGVTPEQYKTYLDFPTLMPVSPTYPLPGPDFSCYLITKECHAKYPFDEAYIPAYCEDLDYHRRLLLGGDGARIFGTGLPFEHIGSGSLNAMDPGQRARKEAQISQGSRQHHAEKWGGGANQETYTRPFDLESAREGVTTAELFERVRNGQPAI